MTVEDTGDLPAFVNLVDLAAERLGGEAIAASDEFFAGRENLVKPGRGVFDPERYTDRGKWMDGWETRRRRTPGHDWCVVRLGVQGVIKGVDIDTNHFVGNHPEHASVDASTAGHDTEPERLVWMEILPKMSLGPGCRNLFRVADARRWTHLRLNIYPDGGVARFRAYGYAVPTGRRNAEGPVDLACITNGGVAIACSDQCFGRMNNMLMPGRPLNMGDGWETRRRRGPGFDWAVVRLGVKAAIERVEVDTTHFKGNHPGSCSVQACLTDIGSVEDFAPTRHAWTEIVSEQPLEADRAHAFDVGAAESGPFTHVRLNIFPDGGVARFRVFGRPVEDP